jgi:DNA topoisomerase IA
VIKPLGLTISTFLHTHFFELFDYDFTQQMECELDKIANNESVWYDVCKQINDKIDATIERLSIDLV